MKLSILVPIYNESNYIGECVKSILSNSSKDFEIVISDNCSTDRSLEVIDAFDDDRIKVILQKTKIAPVANYWSAVNASEGEYIFSIGGDDYLEDGILDKVIPMLYGDNVVIGQMACFDGVANHVFAVVNKGQYIQSLFDMENNFINSYFANLRDEVMYAFIKRSHILSTSGLIDNSLERFLIWQALVLFSGVCDSKVISYDGVILYKRYNKSILSGNYTNDAHNSPLQSLYISKSLSSLYNSFYMFYRNNSVSDLLRVLFKCRVLSSKGGLLGLNKDVNQFYYGALFMFILSPIIDIARLVVSLKKKTDRKN